MERINRIISNPEYQKHVQMIEEWERERVFCRHNTAHFLDVARIAMILNEKDSYGISEEMIYAAALLHDIGRWKQYETGVDHAIASAHLAPPILKMCGFSKEEVEWIESAIATHRQSERKQEKNLNGLLYRADKLSRPCYFCKQQEHCNWKADKKNLEIAI